MKKVIISILLLSSLQSAYAGTLQISCDTNTAERVEIYVSTTEAKNPVYMEIYGQGGLGPNFLDSSYVARESDLTISPDDEIQLKADFGSIVKLDLNYSEKTQGESHIKFKNTKAIELKNCKHSL